MGAQAVARDEGERHGALLAVFGQRARQFGDDEGVVALRRARQRDGAALLKAANGGSDEAHGLSSARVGGFHLRSAQASKERSVEFPRRMLAADDPGERLRVGDVEQTLELGKFVFAHRRQMRIGEAAHDQIHLAHAAAPGAKQNPPPALIERCAGEVEPDIKHLCSRPCMPSNPSAGRT